MRDVLKHYLPPAALLAVLALFGSAARADGDKPAEPRREEVAQCVGPKGRLLRREGDAQNSWKVVNDQEAVSSEDLLVGLPGAEVETKGGGVRLRLVKYINAPLPVLEPAVTLHQSADFDLDFTLERGMAELWNNKPKGSAHVRIRVRGETWEANLDEPGARVLVELYSGWPRGARFTKTPGPKDAPLAHLTFLVLKGAVDLKHAGTQLALSAPPGPAIIEWDSVTGMDGSPQRLEELPAWVLPPTDEAGKALALKIEDVIERFAGEIVKSNSLDAAIDKFLASDNPGDRRLAVVGMAATDQLPRLAKALKESEQPDVWDNAVLALRHWIGRAPGQEQVLYQGILDAKVMSPGEARTVLELLHDFGEDDLARPVTYEMLLHLLDSDKRFIRGLAYWHLSRLVPEGKTFGYNPFGPQEARDAARAKWKELIPQGKLPPPPKEDGK